MIIGVGKMGNTKKKKALFISSTGGHLKELLQLESLFDKFDYKIITERTDSNIKLKDKYGKRISFLIYGSKDHIFSYLFKLFANCFISLYRFIQFRPKYIITTGTHTAGPMCYIGKIFGSKIIYIETFANSSTKTLSGRLIYPIADLFVVQWKSMLKLYLKAKYFGGVF